MSTRILLVEDDEILQALACKVLVSRGYEVVVAASGPAGVAQAITDVTDLVLMDLRLPDLDGWEATRQIKAAKPDLPVVACSANMMSDDIENATAAGCDAFLGKPYQLSELLRTVARFVR